MNKAINRKGLMLILSSPSGGGKSTLANLIIETVKDTVLSVSATTRPKRNGEVDGKHYFFKAHETFADMVKDGEFLEYAKVFDNMYGTPKGFVYDEINAGKDVVFDIDWQGARQLRENAGDDVVSIFILPPSLKELERRLNNRLQDDETVIANRMNGALSEITHWNEYDYVLVNEDLEETLAKIKTILYAERLKRTRQDANLKKITSSF